MMGQWVSGLAGLLATDTPTLPTSAVMALWLHLGWSVVLAWLGAYWVGRYGPGRGGRSAQRTAAAAIVLAAWAWVGGPFAPTYWLGLAFQMPSVLSVMLCAALLRARLWSARSWHTGSYRRNPVCGVTLALALLGVLSGWALLADTLALLPLQLYAWGFSPAAPGVTLLLVLLPWVVFGRASGPMPLCVWAAPIALLVFTVWHLPTGNVWDAVLDPWLWLALHAYLLRLLWRRLSGRR